MHNSALPLASHINIYCVESTLTWLIVNTASGKDESVYVGNTTQLTTFILSIISMLPWSLWMRLVQENLQAVKYSFFFWVGYFTIAKRFSARQLICNVHFRCICMYNIIMFVTLWLHVGVYRYSYNGDFLLRWHPALEFSVSFQGCAVFSEHVSILYKRTCMQCWRCKHCDKRTGCTTDY